MPVSPSDAVLVVGAGQAGLQLATSLRESGHQGPITLIGDEACSPYQRPPLSKAYLSGALAETALALRGDAFYNDRRIELVRGERIESVALDGAAAGGGQATSATGRVFTFDGLALALGGGPRRLPVPGVTLPGVHYLRDVADSAALRADLDLAQHVVVIGGGFIGLEVAAGATARGKHVTVVETTDRLLGRAVAPVTSEFYATAHRARGTAIEFNVTVTAVTGSSRVDGVELADGRWIEADVVVIGIGMTPHTLLAERAGLACAGGIVVDADARTSAPGVVAAGDCTVTALPGGGYLHVESVNNAIAQAKRAAASILGAPRPSTGVAWFWSDQHDLKLQIAGLNAGYEQVVVRGETRTESFSVLYYRDDRLIAIDAINAPRDYMAVRRILDAGATVPASAATDTATELKQFLRVPA